MYTMTYGLELENDRTMTLKLPYYIPLGFHKILLVVDENPVPVPDDKFDELLKQTKGMWKSGDGLAYQVKLRDEWERD